MIFMQEKVSAHLSKELRLQYKRRSMGVRKGDEVKVVRGEHRGKAGAVTEIDRKSSRILIGGVTIKRTVGTEKQVPIRPSSVVITSLSLDDNARQKILLRKVKEVKVEKKAPAPPAPAAEEKKAEAPAEKIEEKKAAKPRPKVVKARPAKEKKVKK